MGALPKAKRGRLVVCRGPAKTTGIHNGNPACSPGVLAVECASWTKCGFAVGPECVVVGVQVMPLVVPNMVTMNCSAYGLLVHVHGVCEIAASSGSVTKGGSEW